MPASEVVGDNGPHLSSVDRQAGESYSAGLWRAFKGCGRGIVNYANGVLLYPIYVLNAVKVYVVGGKKIDGAEYIRDPYASIFENEKRTYKSAFQQTWNEYWANEVKAAKTAAQAVANFEEIIAKSASSYAALSSEEKSVVNCALTSGLGTGFALKAAQSVALRTSLAVGNSSRAQPLVNTPLIQAARERAASRHNQTNAKRTGANSSNEAIPGLEVREIYYGPDALPVSSSEMMKIYGEFDPTKVIKAKDVPTPPVTVATGKRYRAHLDVGDGRKMQVEFEIVSPVPQGGYVTIRFENPLHRGQITERRMRRGELEISPGFRELDNNN